MKHVDPEALIGAFEIKEGDPVEPDQIVTKALADLTATVDSRLKEVESKAADTSKLVERLDKVEATLNRPAIIKKGDGELSEDRKAFIEFVRKGVERMDQKAVAALTVSTDSQGGYLAPEAFGAEILKKIVEWSPIRNYASVMSISAESVSIPRKLTGSTATWVSETGDRTQSDVTFEQQKFTPFIAAEFVDVSTQLLQDNVHNLEGLLSDDFGEAFGKAEAKAFVSGDGTDRPKGLLTATGIAEVKTGNAATLGTDPAATIIGMFHKVPSVVAQRGVWLMNRNTLGTLRTLKDGTGRFIMLDPITAGAPVTLLGRPIVDAVDMPDVAANAYPIMFGDMAGYRIVDRVGLSVLRDPYSQATKGLVRFHANMRVGGDVSHPDRFVKLKVAA